MLLQYSVTVYRSYVYLVGLKHVMNVETQIFPSNLEGNVYMCNK
jgi:hypothetical protein